MQLHFVQTGIENASLELNAPTPSIERAIQSQALREAATKARTQANALASALDLQIVRVLSVKESVPVSRPIRDNVLTARAEYSAVQTPVESGTLEVRATVTLTVEVSPK
jgi:uncharacterized protein